MLVGSDTRFQGADGAQEFSRMWADGFPDGRVEFDTVTDAGDTIVIQHTGRGTQPARCDHPAGKSRQQGDPSPCSSATSSAYATARSSHSTVTSTPASLLTQIGVMPATESGVTN